MNKNKKLLFAAGILYMLAWNLPYLILGKDAVYTYHDQLDGEMVAYILQAKHLGSGSILPEFLDGAAKTALTPPAPGCVLLFWLCMSCMAFGRQGVPGALPALFSMQLLGSMMGYLGMYLLVRRVTRRETAAVTAGVLYGMLPFLPVYGLSQFGLPLLVWCVLCLRADTAGVEDVQGERLAGKKFIQKAACLGYGAFFALNSSLVLVGFAVLAVLAAWILVDRLRSKLVTAKRKKAGSYKVPSLLLLWLLMAGIYCLANGRLIGQVLGIGEAELSHKVEYVLVPEGFWRGWLEAFLWGGQHSADYHIGILGFALVMLLIVLIKKWSGYTEKSSTKKSSIVAGALAEGKQTVKVILLCMGINLIFAFIAALWNSAAGVALRAGMGALGAFQLDRFLWLAPCVWYLMLGCCIEMVAEVVLGGTVSSMRRRLAQALHVLILLAVLGGTGFQILKNSDTKSNLQKLRNPDYPILSYSDYYGLGVLEQVADFLRQETGMPQEGYRVVSLGIDPAAALYHGFYCLDGYSNNYSLAYKHAFRQVIAPALAQSEYLRAYFDDWGNRCYIFGTESPGYYTIQKNGFYFQHLEIDTKALSDMGGDYLLSAAYIANSEELGLTLMRQEPFETEDSYYRIFLYAVTQMDEGL